MCEVALGTQRAVTHLMEMAQLRFDVDGGHGFELINSVCEEAIRIWAHASLTEHFAQLCSCKIWKRIELILAVSECTF
jgi:hypothetical protein